MADLVLGRLGMSVESVRYPEQQEPCHGAVLDGRRPRWLAPVWHTAALVGLYVAVAIVGVVTLGGAAQTTKSTSISPIAAIYLPTIVVQIALAAWAVRIGRERSALTRLLGRRWTTVWRALGDVGLAGVAFVSIRLIEALWLTTSAGPGPGVAAILPHTAAECGAWIFFSIVVGISEELVFRGYLQSQLEGFTRRPNLAWALQALLFGVAHLSQGVAGAARVAIYGLLLGLLSRARRSLIPGMLCHVAIDLASGLSGTAP